LEKFLFTILGITTSHSNIGSYTLVLGDSEGRRRLPIIIGAVEAQAIMMEIENIRPHRPMTHDLMFNICNDFGIVLQEICIIDVKDAVFFARLIFSTPSGEKELDARPSDAIALAVRFKAPIYVNEKVFMEAGVDIRESSGKDDPVLNPPPQEQEPEPEKLPSKVSKGEQLQKLKQKMEEAIQNEDYEKAAFLRDQIQKLENS